MDEKAKAARRAYKRAWAQKNPEKIKAQQERYWTKKATQAEQEPEHKEDPTNAGLSSGPKPWRPQRRRSDP